MRLEGSGPLPPKTPQPFDGAEHGILAARFMDVDCD
jgi:hypothetical protein